MIPTILEILSRSNLPLSLHSISCAVELNKTTVHGLLATLHALGYVTKEQHGYSLGLRFRELSKPLEQKDEKIRQQFNPLLQKMAQLSNNTAYLAVQSGIQEYLYIDAIEQSNPLTIHSPRGNREGLTTSAIGKVFLALNDDLKRTLRRLDKMPDSLENELKIVKQQGFALDLERAERGLNCLAIPLYADGKLAAVAGISGSATQLTPAKLRHFAQLFLRS
ncbi:IclR family transcriptional regulator [Vibrio gallicus]|uniref:IclR family transcriptional regulator n=1 Tax=Vibrio gallicus TaxID=190897 RepID=UPI0021C430EF|nr:IclR family transcriptional regulator C-terminal domain-containing protein [Vibrio gallicus]